MFEVREIMVSVSPLERGLRGVLKLAIRRNDNTFTFAVLNIPIKI